MEESKIVDALQALGHATRLQAFRLLVVAGPNGLPAGSLATAIGVPSSTLSSHLSRLEHAGLVQSQRRSRQIFYAIQIEAVRRLLGYLIEDCCQGEADLCGGIAALTTVSCEECQ
nr:metalloregulator ArsR/SmtB family transcription factor [Polymorphobacter sp.]